MNKTHTHFVQLMLCIVVVLVYSFMALGAPTAPATVSNLGSETSPLAAGTAPTVNALAGNLTKITIDADGVTQNWAGLYGNISGTIVLDDADNYSLFTWTADEPSGEVYAVNQTISDWSTVHCFNFTNPDNTSQFYYYDGKTKNTTTTSFLTLEQLENAYAIDSTASDGVDETFNYSNSHDGFFVGDVEILADECPAVTTYQNDLPQSENFQEVLLTINDTEVVIFTTLIENRDTTNLSDKVGFNNEEADFQLMVIEDGKNGDTSVTPYYIYTELS